MGGCAHTAAGSGIVDSTCLQSPPGASKCHIGLHLSFCWSCRIEEHPSLAVPIPIKSSPQPELLSHGLDYADSVLPSLAFL